MRKAVPDRACPPTQVDIYTSIFWTALLRDGHPSSDLGDITVRERGKNVSSPPIRNTYPTDNPEPYGSELFLNRQKKNAKTAWIFEFGVRPRRVANADCRGFSIFSETRTISEHLSKTPFVRQGEYR